MFERFTDRARVVLVLAQEEARLLNHSFIGTEHILLGLIHEGEGYAAKALESLDISLEAARQEVENIVGPPTSPPTESPPFTPRAKKVLELSLREALQLHHNFIGTEHLLLGLVAEGEGVGCKVLVSLGVALETVRHQVMLLIVVGPELRPLASARIAPAPAAGVAAEDPRRRVGEYIAYVVQVAGRTPEAFADAYGRLEELARQQGIDLGASRIEVTSVQIDEGPGLRLSLRRITGEQAAGTGGPAAGGWVPLETSESVEKSERPLEEGEIPGEDLEE